MTYAETFASYGLPSIGINDSHAFNEIYLAAIAPLLGEHAGTALEACASKLLRLQETHGKVLARFGALGNANDGSPREDAYQQALDLVLAHSTFLVKREGEALIWTN